MTLSLNRIRELRAAIKDGTTDDLATADLAMSSWAEIDSALAAAEVLARLEAWLRAAPHRFASASQLIDEPKCIQARFDEGGWRTDLSKADELLAALTAALDEAGA